MKYWIAFFSQTGSEILDISRRIGRFPDVIVSNNTISNISPKLLSEYEHSDKNRCIMTGPNVTIDTYKEILKDCGSKCIVTLNGWLKIIPPEICSNYNIYNGHPGLISQYPELRGKDPVERIWVNIDNYTEAGSVIHEVVPAVDEGKIISESSFNLSETSFINIEGLNKEIRAHSLNLWVDFLRLKLKLIV